MASGMALSGGGSGSARMEILSPPCSLCDGFSGLPSTSTPPCASSSCTRARLMWASVCVRKMSRRWPLAWGGASRMLPLAGMRRLQCFSATQPKPSTRDDHRRRHRLANTNQPAQQGGAATVAAQKSEEEVGDTGQKEPRSHDFSIVMGTAEEPEQQGEDGKLGQARVDLRGMEWN